MVVISVISAELLLDGSLSEPRSVPRPGRGAGKRRRRGGSGSGRRPPTPTWARNVPGRPGPSRPGRRLPSRPRGQEPRGEQARRARYPTSAIQKQCALYQDNGPARDYVATPGWIQPARCSIEPVIKVLKLDPGKQVGDDLRMSSDAEPLDLEQFVTKAMVVLWQTRRHMPSGFVCGYLKISSVSGDRW